MSYYAIISGNRDYPIVLLFSDKERAERVYARGQDEDHEMWLWADPFKHWESNLCDGGVKVYYGDPTKPIVLEHSPSMRKAISEYSYWTMFTHFTRQIWTQIYLAWDMVRTRNHFRRELKSGNTKGN